jgi:hypothetical protein
MNRDSSGFPSIYFCLQSISQSQLNRSTVSNIAQAEQELEMVTKLFNGIVGTISSRLNPKGTCHKKCINSDNYTESDLSKGESVCVGKRGTFT